MEMRLKEPEINKKITQLTFESRLFSQCAIDKKLKFNKWILMILSSNLDWKCSIDAEMSVEHK